MSGFLGLDWGTHSSKWAFQQPGLNPFVGPIWDSAVSLNGTDLTMHTLDQRNQDPTREVALKRKLIQDPDQPFWEGPRPKLGVTLGESVVFSIFCLLLDADRNLRARGKSFKDKGSVIRFSHPNWISSENVRALGCFRDAAIVALSAFIKYDGKNEDSRRITVPTQIFKETVDRHKAFADDLPRFTNKYSHGDYMRCTRGNMEGIEWEFVFESCAAGFPYIYDADPETYETPLRKYPANRQVKKILVVDVGAGSTDAGYLVRTIRTKDVDKQGIMRPLLIWLPAADALELAGRWLTDKIQKDLAQQGRRVTADEAEELKLAPSGTWQSKPYVKEWTDRIAAHIGEYAKSIHDDVCLPNKPALEVVITGGSSAVNSMRIEVVDQVKAALMGRGIPIGESTKLLESQAFGLEGNQYDSVRIAQLAVSLGASHPYLSELKAYPSGLSSSLV